MKTTAGGVLGPGWSDIKAKLVVHRADGESSTVPATVKKTPGVILSQVARLKLVSTRVGKGWGLQDDNQVAFQPGAEKHRVFCF
jgi:hypothetical protein